MAGTLEEKSARAEAAFAARAGRRPDGVWAAPGRVNLIGEHTDYNDGYVLPIAIDRHVVAAIGARGDGRLRCWSLEQGEAVELAMGELGPGRVEGWAAYPAAVAWVLASAHAVGRGGADVLVHGDVPLGAGLSSSAALECAVALGLAELHGARFSGAELARIARRAENEGVGAPVGIMDQMIAISGRAGHALFLDTRTLATEQLPLGLEAAGLCLLVIDTGAAHRHAGGEYAARRRSCEAAAQALGVPALRDATLEQVERAAARLGEVGLRRARHVVTEDQRVLEAVARLRAGALEGIGPLLDASHASLRDDFEVSSAELDTAVEAARAAGALGARMTGGGFGGSAIALARAADAGQVAAAAEAAFAEHGLAPPRAFQVSAADGAHRVA